MIDRYLKIDMIRIISIIFIITIHSSAPVVMNTLDHQSIDWNVGNFYDTFSRWAVPAFVILSGYLILDPQKDRECYVDFYKRRLNKILLPLIFWSAIYMIWSFFKFLIKSGYNTESTFENILNLNTLMYYHLWFIYMIAFLYLITPLLRILIDKLNTRGFILLIFGSLLSSIIIFFKEMHVEVLPFALLFIKYIPFYLLGRFFRTYNINKKYIYLAIIFFCIIGLITTILNSHFVALFGIEKGLFLYQYNSPITILMSIIIFYILINANYNFFEKYKNSINKISSLTFGIYLIHPIALESSRLVVKSESIYPLASIPLNTVFVFIVSALITYLFSKNIFLSKLV